MNKLKELIESLRPYSPNPEAEIDTILKLEFNTSLVEARAYGIPHSIFEKLSEIVRERIKTGRPVQYILGKALFYGRVFIVNEHVLIPRVETELLVEKAISIIREYSLKKIVDVGTGSGIIAITLKKEFPQLEVIATDISFEALEVARKNAALHGVRINFVQCDLLSCFDDKFDLVISNPPYLGENEPLGEYRRFEPQIALYGGKKGLELSFQLINQAKNRLKKPGYIIMEINPFTASELVKELRDYELFKDYNGMPRVLVIKNG